MKELTQINNNLFIKILALIVSIGTILLLHAFFEFNIIFMWGLLLGVVLFFIKSMWYHL